MILELDLTEEEWQEIATAISDGGSRVESYETTCRERAQEFQRIAEERYRLSYLIQDALNQRLTVS